MTDDYFEKYKKELNKLNLKTTEDLENLLKPLIKEATKITLNESKEIPGNSHLISQFCGQPYFEKGEKWPKARGSSRNNHDLEFIFQIYNDNNIVLPENVKLIQFYYDFKGEDSYDTKDGGWLVKIYECINPENYLFIKKPIDNIVNYCEIKYEQIKSLPDWEGIDTYCPNSSNLSYVLDKNEPWKNYYEIAEKLIGEQNLGSQLGGYPSWIQGDQSPDNNDFILLFQLDSEGKAGLMWVDCGMVYVFYNVKTNEIKYIMQYH
jgi:uncharacterized protein YwqG